jgi:hypothetical protein
VSDIGLTDVNYGYIVTTFSLRMRWASWWSAGFTDRGSTKSATPSQSAVQGLAAASHSLVSFPIVVAMLIAPFIRSAAY